MRSERPRVCGSWASMTRVSVSTVRIRVWIGSISILPHGARGPAAGLACAGPPPGAGPATARVFGSFRPRLHPGSRTRLKRGRVGVDNDRVSEPDPTYEFSQRELDPLQPDGAEPTVLAWRSAQDWADVRELVVRTDARVAELMLSLVRETAEARN